MRTGVKPLLLSNSTCTATLRDALVYTGLPAHAVHDAGVLDWQPHRADAA
jgi:hypothetical protein